MSLNNLDKIDKVVKQWSVEKPLLDTEPMALIGRLLRISKHLETALAKCYKKYDLTLGEFDVLATLRRSGEDIRLTPSELLDALLLSSGAMTNRLDKLESKSLINRRYSEHDKRSLSVGLTNKGRELIDLLIEEHVQHQQHLVESLTKEQQKMLSKTLKVWLGSME